MRALFLAVLMTFTGVADFSGTFEGSLDSLALTMTLKQDGNTLSGTAKGTVAGTDLKMSITGTVDGETANGTLKFDGDADEDKLTFKATISGDKLTMKIAGEDENGKVDWSEPETIEFKKTSGTTAPDPKTGDGKTKFSDKVKSYSTKPIDILTNGKEYVHGSGGKMRYPANWKLVEQEEFLQLIPPDAAPREEIMILSEKAQGATDPSSKEILAHLDAQVMAAVPGVKRIGEPEKASAGVGRGVFLVWEGQVEGQAAQVRAYVTILSGYGVALVAGGPKGAVEKRDKQLREIFYTFGWGQGKRDEKLVGTWKHWAYAAVSGRESTARCDLRADGTFSYESSSEMAANYKGTNAQGDQTAWGAMYSRSGNGFKGTWTAFGGEIILNFEDGTSETFDYNFKQEGANTFLVTTGADKSKAMEWSRG